MPFCVYVNPIVKPDWSESPLEVKSCSIQSLLTTIWPMAREKLICQEDTNIEDILQAWHEGRLFIDPRRCDNKEEVANHIIEYVKRIDSLVTPSYRASIDALWHDILNCKELSSLLMPTGRSGYDKFNKYGVLRIIGILINNKVYDNRNAMDYFFLLENSKDKNNKFRPFLGRGINDRNKLLKLKEIIRNHKV